jgi:glycosyltransferase involved in cell wall biosynthesis
LYFLLQKLIGGIDIQGYAAMICIILFLGGVQLFGIGILGQYIAKIFIEVKRRPLYIVSESTRGDKNE